MQQQVIMILLELLMRDLSVVIFYLNFVEVKLGCELFGKNNKQQIRRIDHG